MQPSLPLALLAGGMATRLHPVTHTIPKAMIEVAGKPFIAHQLRLLARNGIRRVVICAGYLGEQIASYVGDGSRFDVNVVFSYDGEQLLGTGGALHRALPLLGNNAFLVMYGDSYINIDFQRIVEYYNRYSREGLMTLYRNQDQWDQSNVVFHDGEITRYDKKNRTPDMQYIDYGLGILTPGALAAWDRKTAFDLAQVYQALIARRQLLGYEVHERFYEIGSFAGLKETEEYLQRQDQ
ncbi:nucleotidyltransferase family protein [candidate division FCPU426 bacterium]|nr:nucleotidyltransferase family protein [candidate division FCPU426 bacterium]